MLSPPDNSRPNDYWIEYRVVGNKFANTQSTGNHDEFIIAVKEVNLSVRDGKVGILA